MPTNTNNLGPQSFGNNGLPLNAATLAIKAGRDPGTGDKAYPYGQQWINTSTLNIFVLVNVANGAANWQQATIASSAPTFSGGDLTVSNGNVKISGAGKQLQIEGGAATDFIGTATLVSGTVTVANTNIAATDRIIPFLISANASTVLGRLTYTISAGASFTITSKDPSTPANTLTGDVSTVGYLIVRQL